MSLRPALLKEVIIHEEYYNNIRYFNSSCPFSSFNCWVQQPRLYYFYFNTTLCKLGPYDVFFCFLSFLCFKQSSAFVNFHFPCKYEKLYEKLRIYYKKSERSVNTDIFPFIKRARTFETPCI